MVLFTAAVGNMDEEPEGTPRREENAEAEQWNHSGCCVIKGLNCMHTPKGRGREKKCRSTSGPGLGSEMVSEI